LKLKGYAQVLLVSVILMFVSFSCSKRITHALAPSDLTGTPAVTNTRTTTVVIYNSPTVTWTRTKTPTLVSTSTTTLVLTATATYTASPVPTITTTPIKNDSKIQYYGRWDFTNPAAPQNGWGTVYMLTKFEGTSISINLSGWDSWYAYAIDDTVTASNFTKFEVRNDYDSNHAVATQTPIRITGLADTTHTIIVVRRTEGSGGINVFKGFGLDYGKVLVDPGTKTTRKIEIIGDSITCGSVNEYQAAVPTPDAYCPWGTCIQNGSMTYGVQIARHYGAEWRTISRGGLGMFRNCNGCTPMNTITDIYPNTYFEMSPSAGSTKWNTSSWQPDIIILALGTNDASVGDLSLVQSDFENAYSNFLTYLRAQYASAQIVCVEPLPNWVGTKAGQYISNVVTAKNSGGDANIYYVAINNPAITTGFPLNANEYAGDNTHPLIPGHTKLANALETWIDANLLTKLGW